MSDHAKPTPRRSPRSERARAAILAAAVDLLPEVGFPTMTMEAIAARAGASKATVYRHWPSKAALVMDALLDRADAAAPFPDTGSAVDDFARQLRATAELFRTDPVHSMMSGLISALPGDPDLRAAFATRYLRPRRAQAAEALRRGVDRGELAADIRVDLLLDQLYGALYLRLILGSPAAPDEAEAAARQLFRGLGS